MGIYSDLLGRLNQRPVLGLTGPEDAVNMRKFFMSLFPALSLPSRCPPGHGEPDGH